MDKLKTKVKLLATGMAVSETTREICPTCGGGSSEEKSFAITRDRMGLIYCCHRASCGVRGFIPTNGALTTNHKIIKPNKTHKFEHQTEELPDEWVKYLKDKLYFSDAEISAGGLRYVPDTGRIYYPVRDIRGYTIGATCRDYSGRDSKKSIAYPENSDKSPFASFYPHPKGGRSVILVEDCASAIRASSYTNAVALMGTQLPDSLVGLLSSIYTTVYLALDRDAIMQSLRIKNKYDLSFDRFVMLLLPKDIKDMTREELDKFMEKSIK